MPYPGYSLVYTRDGLEYKKPAASDEFTVWERHHIDSYRTMCVGRNLLMNHSYIPNLLSGRTGSGEDHDGLTLPSCVTEAARQEVQHRLIIIMANPTCL